MASISDGGNPLRAPADWNKACNFALPVMRLAPGISLRIAQNAEGLGFDHPLGTEIEEIPRDIVALDADAGDAVVRFEIIRAAGVAMRRDNQQRQTKRRWNQRCD